jgi:hypothetical protein
MQNHMQNQSVVATLQFKYVSGDSEPKGSTIKHRLFGFLIFLKAYVRKVPQIDC